ncbi:MAG TPA: NAD(P)-dependent oxidoreductase [Polyangiaceae bacterium]|nr:NAD(P)-dependent oxidoreductase [Polyangiaceae bacterium]
MIAFYGMGLLGSNFVRALLARGERVQVWNRSPERARALEVEGARAFEDPADAARGAERVHLTLSDDAAVDAVLERAAGGFGPGALVVDHTTTSAEGAAARHERWRARGVEFLHAPVFMGPQNAREGTGIMLASGDEGRFERAKPALMPMTGKLVYLGPDPGRAAAFKLFGNLFLMAMSAGVADVLALAKAHGVSAAEAASLFDHFNPASMLPARARRMVEGEFANASWELAMARKDARLMLEAAERGGAALMTTPAIARRMDEFIERGHAHDDWLVISKDAL